MKKISLLSVVVAAFMLASCGSSIMVPKALNTVATASFADLNLRSGDYQILNTVSADATVYLKVGTKTTTISDEINEFVLTYVKTKKGIEFYHSGVLRVGYLGNDYSYDPNEKYSAEDVARRLAIYRLINAAKQNGADGIIEPTISTNVEQKGKTIVFKTTASAKIIKLNTHE